MNFVRGRRVFGKYLVQLSAAPFLFSRGIWMTFNRGVELRVRSFELLIGRWPFST